MAGKLKAKAMKSGMHKMPNGKMMKNSAMKKHKKMHEKMESKKHEKSEDCG